MKEEKILSVRDLKVIYTSKKKTVEAVNGVSFDIQRGETLALVGETGAGKTTIAKGILGILPNPPAKLIQGEIWFNGEDLAQASESRLLGVRGNKIAMIFQDPMTALNPLQTVGDQITEVILLHDDCTKTQAKEKAGAMLETVGIPAARYQEYPFQFSGGMKQRVVIAMALACNPELILADEPTTALDVTIQAQVLDLIKELKVRYQTSMLLISHDLGVVAETCDHVAVVYAGKIVEYGTKEDIFLHAAHPYTVGLFASLPSMSTTSKRLKPINGSLPDPTRLPPGCAFAARCSYATQTCFEGEVPIEKIGPGHLCRCLRKTRGDCNGNATD